MHDVIRMTSPAIRQRGWLGLVGLLIALVIVAVLAQTVLRSYGMLGGGERAAKAGARGPGMAAPASADTTGATPAITAPIERTRALEKQVQRDAQDLDRRIDEQTK